MTQRLSLSAQAIFDSYKAASDGCYSGGEWLQNEAGQIAAALRVAADQVVPVPINAQTSEEHWALLGVKNRLLAIADEIETQ